LQADGKHASFEFSHICRILSNDMWDYVALKEKKIAGIYTRGISFLPLGEILKQRNRSV